MYFIEFVWFNDATCSYYVTGGSFIVSRLFVGVICVISSQHVSSVRCNTPGLCWYDGALETVGGQLWRFRDRIDDMSCQFDVFTFFFSQKRITRELLPFFQLRISILTEWFQVEPHWWTCRWMGSGLSYRNYFSHFSCLFKQTVLRENLSNDLNGLESLRLLFSQQHVQVQCFLMCFCSKLTSALRFANLRFIVPQCLEPIDVQEFVHRMEARKEFEKICLDGFLSKKLLQIPFQPRFQALDYPGDPAELAAQLCKAPTLLTRTGAPLACWYVAYLSLVSICTHDLNNLSAFSCFFYSYVFMCSLPEAPGMKFSLEFFVVNSLCRTSHRICILIFLFFQSCQPCEVHNIQVQCRRSCTSTIGKNK